MSADTHTEIETKFDAEGSVDLAALATVDGVAGLGPSVVHDLDAEYFDTAGLDLLTAGIVLRRRRGGHDAGWHLKIPRSRSERVEIHEPLGASRNQPPQRLRDLVTARTRQAPLERVARLRTRRTVHQLLDEQQAPVAEVADDTVTADAAGQAPSTWREIEVELIGGGRDVLAAVEQTLHKQGAATSNAGSKLARFLADRLPHPVAAPALPKSSTAGDVVRHYLRGQAAVLVDVDPAVRIDLPDAVHKMRVATRRLRSALATYRNLLDTDITEPVRAEPKWLGGVLGSVRDAEVIRDHLRHAVDSEPPDLVIGPVRERIDRTLDARHRAAHEDLLNDLTSPRYLHLLAALDHLPDTVQGKRAAKSASKVLVQDIRQSHTRMRHRLNEALAAAGDDPDDLLHNARKAAKRVRYAAESSAPTVGAKADKLATRMEAAQETLGTHQDTVVVRNVLRDLATEAINDAEPSFTYGHLYALEQHRGDQARAAFLDLVDHGWARRPSWIR